jgi:F0F1-type ATP synthase assembly protein I
MSHHRTPSSSDPLASGSSSASSEHSTTSRSLDPWVAASRLGGGVLCYGALGWLLDRWWDTSFLAPLGIVLGACLGMYVTFSALRAR